MQNLSYVCLLLRSGRYGTVPQLNNALNVHQIAKRRAKLHKYGRFSEIARLDVRTNL